MLAIIIPTFNRELYLSKLLDSALKQSNRDFILYIGDDGSSDNTRQLIDKYRTQLDIKYYYHDNMGKFKTLKKIFPDITEEIFTIIDSDSKMHDNFVKIILKDFKKYKAEKLTGFFYLIDAPNNKIIGDSFPINYEKSDFYYGIKNVLGDKVPVIITKFIKDLKLKTYENEYFTSEVTFMDRISLLGYCILVNNVILTVTYDENGITNNMNEIVKNNPRGYINYH